MGIPRPLNRARGEAPTPRTHTFGAMGAAALMRSSVIMAVQSPSASTFRRLSGINQRSSCNRGHPGTYTPSTTIQVAYARLDHWRNGFRMFEKLDALFPVVLGSKPPLLKPANCSHRTSIRIPCGHDIRQERVCSFVPREKVGMRETLVQSPPGCGPSLGGPLRSQGS